MKMHPKRILVFVDWYLPAVKAGGPVKSIAALVAHFKNDFEFYIVTSNTDFGDTTVFPDVAANTWNVIDENVQVFYGSPDYLSIKNIKKLVSAIQYDLVYVNSFFSFRFSIVPLLLFKRNFLHGPLLIAPRGMLGAGALALKSTKKKAFIAVSKLAGLHRKCRWHATSEQERKEIEVVFGKSAHIDVVPNLQYPNWKQELQLAIKKAGELRLFFVSRVSEKKNLLFALKRLHALAGKGNVRFTIIGPVEDKHYWNACQLEIEQLKKEGIDVVYVGLIANDQLSGALKDEHFLFLPTMNENYGHVIVESFLLSKPVLISDQTPWRGLEKSGAGWDLPLENIPKFEEILDTCLRMDANDYETHARAAQVYGNQHCEINEAVEKMKSLLKQLTNA